jgi:hypothetical protein
MCLNFRKTIKLGKHLKANVSKKGVSFSANLGRLTVNSNGRKTIRLGKGFNYTFGKNKRR